MQTTIVTRGRYTERILAIAAVLFAVNTVSGFAQSTGETRGIDRAEVIREFDIPEDKAEDTLRIVNGLIEALQDASKRMVTLLSQQDPERLLDPQVSSRIDQIRRGFGLKLERLQLDLSEIVGEEKAEIVTAKFRSIIPNVLLEQTPAPEKPQVTAAPLTGAASGIHPAAPRTDDPALQPAAPGKPAEVPLGSALIGPSANVLDLSITDPSNGSSAGGMGGMGGGMMGMMDMMMGRMNGMGGMGSSGSSGNGATAPNAQTLEQVLSTNNMVVNLLQSFAAQPGGITPAQFELVEKLLANQSALIEVLSAGSAPSGSAGSGGSMGGMSGMGGM